MVGGMGDSELELGLPSGEKVEDGEWVLAIFELGKSRRATSAAARASVGPDGQRLVFEPRDWRRLAEFSRTQAQKPSIVPAPVARESKTRDGSGPSMARDGSNPSTARDGSNPSTPEATGA